MLGEVAGDPFYSDADHYRRWSEPAIVLDVASGAREGFSGPSRRALRDVVALLPGQGGVNAQPAAALCSRCEATLCITSK
jgi:hypothetical protein